MWPESPIEVPSPEVTEAEMSSSILVLLSQLDALMAIWLSDKLTGWESGLMTDWMSGWMSDYLIVLN